MLHQMTRILEGLLVYPERMRENMDESFGLHVLPARAAEAHRQGPARQTAYELVQRNAMRAWRERTTFRDLLAADAEVMAAALTSAELDECFDPAWHLRNVEPIYRRSPDCPPEGADGMTARVLCGSSPASSTRRASR